jgi:hypothetical protein
MITIDTTLNDMEPSCCSNMLSHISTVLLCIVGYFLCFRTQNVEYVLAILDRRLTDMHMPYAFSSLSGIQETKLKLSATYITANIN